MTERLERDYYFTDLLMNTNLVSYQEKYITTVNLNQYIHY
jgi:hypothetical protein